MRLLLLILCCFFSTLVWALNVLPSSVQPERQTTRTPTASVPYSPTDLLSVSPTAPSVDVSVHTVYFLFNGFIFEGATLLSEREVLPLYQDKLGKEITLAQLYEIANNIEQLYMADGYILTRVIIPAQEIDHGEKIKLIIVEGFIDQIDIETDNASLKAFLTEMAEPILESKPLKLTDLEAALLRMNDLPGISVRSVLSPSPTTVGASRLTIEVYEKDYAAVAHIDNRGTKWTGPTEYLASVTANNPGGYISETTLEGTATDPWHEMQAASITHIKPFGQYGAFFEGVLNYSQVNPGYTLTPLDVHGYSSSLQLATQQALIRQRSHNLSAWMRYDVSNSKTNSLGELLYLDRIESIRGGFVFDLTDNWQGSNLITGEISQGVNLFTGQNEPHILRSRFFGTKDYTKVNAQVTRLQQLPDNFAIFISGQAQYSANPLLVAEEFGVGGEDYGIGYDYFEISGDSGYAGRLELRKSYYPDYWGLNFFQPYVTYDGGQVFQKQDGFSQSLVSLGGGFRMNVTEFFTGQLEVGQPLTRKVASTDSKNARVFFYFTAQL